MSSWVVFIRRWLEWMTNLGLHHSSGQAFLPRQWGPPHTAMVVASGVEVGRDSWGISELGKLV